ncbi:hypothetical protein [Hymenobacter weizhouensis]|uniref:hypothetical protein n=1 Tax=Hymenobacter sp. YIM 151500-1 TaxID=2987689 RepID=UPI00222801FB|nr:hypothetical protein [Hymenobacter sp. YIM 151500-1]UYZ64001.1 hypothetical protein OIS53_03940 [Hymenobacter sp. YIM 151500-1]
MKNALLALALFSFVGTAAAHDGHTAGKAKKGKKAAAKTEAHCGKGMAGTPLCCQKKSTKTAAVTPAPAAEPVKSL